MKEPYKKFKKIPIIRVNGKWQKDLNQKESEVLITESEFDILKENPGLTRAFYKEIKEKKPVEKTAKKTDKETDKITKKEE